MLISHECKTVALKKIDQLPPRAVISAEVVKVSKLNPEILRSEPN